MTLKNLVVSVKKEKGIMQQLCFGNIFEIKLVTYDNNVCGKLATVRM
jgi:hypothetical protein